MSTSTINPFEVFDEGWQGFVNNLIDNPAFGVHSIGPDGDFIHISKTELTWLGYKEDEVKGKLRFQDLLAPEDRNRFKERWPHFKESGVATDVEYTLLKKDGNRLPVSINGTAVRDTNGTFIRTMAIVVNLTARKEMEDKATRRALLEQRQQMINLLAHDLRNPVIGSNRLLELMLSGFTEEFSPQQMKIFEVMKQSNDAVLRKIRIMLEILRYEMKDENIFSRTAPLSWILEQAVEHLSIGNAFSMKELVLDVDVVDSSKIMVDQRSLELIITHLLENAIRFSPQNGTVHISCMDDGDQFELTIQDQGPGIPKKYQERLFKDFWQQEPGSTSSSSSSTGTGLYLCARIVEAHGGTISCQSGAGWGTTVTVRMPKVMEREGNPLPY